MLIDGNDYGSYQHAYDVYNEGFCNGQLSIIDTFDEAVESTCSNSDAFLLFKKSIEDIRNHLESM